MIAQVVFRAVSNRALSAQVRSIERLDSEHDLAELTGYYVLIDSGAIRDTNNDWAGFAEEHDLPLEPVLSLAVEPASGEDEEKLLDVTAKLQEEDPTLLFERRVVVVTPTRSTAQDDERAIVGLWRAVGAKVVKQTGEIGNLGLLKVLHDRAASRIFVIEAAE